jgi:CRISPR-associated protein Cmr6
LPDVTDKERKKDEDAAEKLALGNEQFCDVFGCGEESVYGEARQGNIVFFDAFPCAEPTLEVDIMNPHYSDYYNDNDAKTPPADYLSPVPIHFLTVGRQAARSKEALKFQFVLGLRQNSKEDKELLKTATDWLNEALTQQGIGAKTAVGYGYML